MICEQGTGVVSSLFNSLVIQSSDLRCGLKRRAAHIVPLDCRTTVADTSYNAASSVTAFFFTSVEPLSITNRSSFFFKDFGEQRPYHFLSFYQQVGVVL